MRRQIVRGRYGKIVQVPKISFQEAAQEEQGEEGGKEEDEGEGGEEGKNSDGEEKDEEKNEEGYNFSLGIKEIQSN